MNGCAGSLKKRLASSAPWAPTNLSPRQAIRQRIAANHPYATSARRLGHQFEKQRVDPTIVLLDNADNLRRLVESFLDQFCGRSECEDRKPRGCFQCAISNGGSCEIQGCQQSREGKPGFLPISEASDITIPLDGGTLGQFRLLLHGYFFLDTREIAGSRTPSRAFGGSDSKKQHWRRQGSSGQSGAIRP
jgi:hypothetical protein